MKSYYVHMITQNHLVDRFYNFIHFCYELHMIFLTILTRTRYRVPKTWQFTEQKETVIDTAIPLKQKLNVWNENGSKVKSYHRDINVECDKINLIEREREIERLLCTPNTSRWYCEHYQKLNGEYFFSFFFFCCFHSHTCVLHSLLLLLWMINIFSFSFPFLFDDDNNTYGMHNGMEK